MRQRGVSSLVGGLLERPTLLSVFSIVHLEKEVHAREKLFACAFEQELELAIAGHFGVPAGPTTGLVVLHDALPVIAAHMALIASLQNTHCELRIHGIPTVTHDRVPRVPLGDFLAPDPVAIFRARSGCELCYGSPEGNYGLLCRILGRMTELLLGGSFSVHVTRLWGAHGTIKEEESKPLIVVFIFFEIGRPGGSDWYHVLF
jgi:hypothetical protein